MSVLPWVLVFNTVALIMMLLYMDRYLDTISDLLSVRFNISTHNKIYTWIFIQIGLTFLFFPFLYYIYYRVVKQSVLGLSSVLLLFWIMFDGSLLAFSDFGLNPENVLMMIFDCIFGGPILILISIILYSKFKKIISSSGYLIAVLIAINILLTVLFFYNFFVYTRSSANNNRLVKLGDKLKWNKLLYRIRLFKSKYSQSLNLGSSITV